MADRLPLELVVMEFPEPDVPEGVDIALSRLTFLGDIRVQEAAAIVKDVNGTLTSQEVDHLVSSRHHAELPAAPDLLDVGQLERIGRMLDPGRAALALVLEHTWINELAEAFRKARGTVLRSAWLDGSSNGGSHAGHDH
jgi:uncharacterized membrane protein